MTAEPRPSQIAAARLKKVAQEKLGLPVEPWVLALAARPLVTPAATPVSQAVSDPDAEEHHRQRD